MATSKLCNNLALCEYLKFTFVTYVPWDKCVAGLSGYYGNHCNYGNKELCDKNMRKYFKFIFGRNILCDNMY